MSASPIDRVTYDALAETTGAEFVRELVATFLEEAPGMLAELRSALPIGFAVPRTRSSPTATRSARSDSGRSRASSSSAALRGSQGAAESRSRSSNWNLRASPRRSRRSAVAERLDAGRLLVVEIAQLEERSCSQGGQPMRSSQSL